MPVMKALFVILSPHLYPELAHLGQRLLGVRDELAYCLSGVAVICQPIHELRRHGDNVGAGQRRFLDIHGLAYAAHDDRRPTADPPRLMDHLLDVVSGYLHAHGPRVDERGYLLGPLLYVEGA